MLRLPTGKQQMSTYYSLILPFRDSQMDRRTLAFGVIVLLSYNFVHRLFLHQKNLHKSHKRKFVSDITSYQEKRHVEVVKQYLNGSFTPFYEPVDFDGCWYGNSSQKHVGIIIPIVLTVKLPY